jgi:Fic family protein
MEIAALRENILSLPLPPSAVKSLRESARLASARGEAVLSGLKISREEAEGIARRGGGFSARDRGGRGIAGYLAALEWAESNADRPLSENTIKRLNAVAMGSDAARSQPSPYRGNEATRRAGIQPPGARQIPSLMSDLVEWINQAEKELPAPISSAAIHHAIVKIAPFSLGNGQTARGAAALMMFRGGFGLGGFLSLEEEFGENRQQYSDFMDGQNLSEWMEFAAASAVRAFKKVKSIAEEIIQSGVHERGALLRSLSPRQRKILTLFADKDKITSKDVEALMKFGSRSARLLCQRLADEGFLTAVNKADKSRNYRLGDKFRAAVV